MGNPTAYDGQSYNWQKGRQLAGITNTNGQPGISYAYDASGRRISKTVGSVTTNYTYAGGLLVRQSDGTNTLDFAYDASGTAVGFKHNGTPYFYLRNVQGDVTGITNASGVIVAEYTYDAWGNVLTATGAFAQINPIRYRGYYYDTETSWYWLQTRYYVPQWRRFLNADSLFIAGNPLTASNMYAYW